MDIFEDKCAFKMSGYYHKLEVNGIMFSINCQCYI